ncbi:HEPN domain-containing protein [Novosphingobium sp. TCA1]|uniref:HEPN domain-containing protein n=1 Tax=Novosphingobium sp. TCA1 TaxID=2682474 RepID=UPI00130C54C2|nr:HEPN domain-containing protein [Novosphingobium sp. TCA1]GFE77884.1 nucleotidyltransferase [Novosphingobium sp. TCA1]
MRKDIDHLPAVQQGELEKAKATLMSEFEIATSRATQPWKKNGRILKIVLFGSYARNDWVDEPENGYHSDYDILIIVSHENLTDIAEYWYVAEDKMLRDPAIGRQVNIIVHTLQEVNEALNKGEYFWVDIARDGIALYELPGTTLAMPQPLTATDALEMATKYFEEWLPKIDRSITTGQEQMQKGANDLGWRKEASFSFHQAVERSYICYLLVLRHYFPRSHNIKFLRSLAEDREPCLVEAWPREDRLSRRRFELLKRAYVEARYSDSYEISLEDLEKVAEMVGELRRIVEAVCVKRLEKLQRAASH